MLETVLDLARVGGEAQPVLARKELIAGNSKTMDRFVEKSFHKYIEPWRKFANLTVRRGENTLPVGEILRLNPNP